MNKEDREETSLVDEDVELQGGEGVGSLTPSSQRSQVIVNVPPLPADYRSWPRIDRIRQQRRSRRQKRLLEVEETEE